MGNRRKNTDKPNRDNHSKGSENKPTAGTQKTLDTTCSIRWGLPTIGLLAVLFIGVMLMTNTPPLALSSETAGQTCENTKPTNNELTVERRSNLSLDEFIEKYDGRWPVIITDVLHKWKAINWSKEYFAQHYGNQKMFMKAVQGTIHQAESFAVTVDVFSKHTHEGKPWMWTYVEDELFIQTHPELQQHLQQPIYLKEDFFQFLPKEVQPWNAMLLWGTAHSRSSLHIDPYNWTGTNAVFKGKKMWKLYPPGQDQYFYVYKNRRCSFPLDCFKYNSPIDAFAPDLEKFPLFAKAKALTFTQYAGDLLIIPTGWFHQAFNPEESIAVSSQVMNSQNYKICLEEIFKAGEVDLRRIPNHFDELSPADQVMAMTRLIPEYVLKKGKQLTQDLLKQLQ